MEHKFRQEVYQFKEFNTHQMTIQITLSRRVTYIGAGSLENADGVEIIRGKNFNTVIINLIPESDTCIQVPVEDVPALARALEDIVADHYTVKLSPTEAAGSHNADGYLAVDGEVQYYRRGEAIRKARRFGGKIEKVV